jgi:hypothetical protein
VAADVEIKNLLNDTSYPELYQALRKEWLDQILGNKQGPVEAAPSPIPDPKCVENPPDEAKSVPKDEALNAINKFCGEKKYWDKQIVSPVSMTTDQGKVTGASDSYPVNGDSDKPWLQLAFAEEGRCQGSFAFTTGKNDDEKLKHCVDRFSKFLEKVSSSSFHHSKYSRAAHADRSHQCDSNSDTDKHGGTLTDVCAVYRMTTVGKDDSNPHPLKGTDGLGPFVWVDT